MIKSKSTSIKNLLSDSLFEQPIMIDGVVVNEPRTYNEDDLWDLTHIFDGTPNWFPKKYRDTKKLP
jgi:hypothetical protein